MRFWIKKKYWQILVHLNYVKRFGFSYPIIYNKLRRNTTEMLEIKYKGQYVKIRTGTSDIYSFEDVFVNLCYKIKIKFIPDVIIDAGANAGHASVFFKLIYPQVKIIAIEPEQSNCKIIKKNCNYFTNIYIEPFALYGKETVLCLSNPKASKWAYNYIETEKISDVYSIKTITVDQIIKKYQLRSIDIFKIDIEGSEKSLFEDISCQQGFG